MAEDPLVGNDLSRGASLVAKLRSADFPVEFAAWSYSDEDDQWRLLLATPIVDTEGRLAAYSRIEELVGAEPWLHPGVNRLTVVGTASPALDAFRRLAGSMDTDDAVIHGQTGEIGGRSISDSYVYVNDALAFEQELAAALQRVVPTSAIIRRGERVLESRAPDFVLDGGDGPVFIEAKAHRRPVTRSELRSIVAAFLGHAPCVVVSRSGFTTDATAGLGGDALSVRWRDSDDDDALRVAVLKALADRSSMRRPGSR